VIWSLTGLSNTQLDQQGEIVISDASGLRAFDLTGCEILPENGRFVLPFGQVPVYITTERLSVTELRDRIARGMIRHVTPVNMYALSLTASADRKQTLSVRIENQLNRPVEGNLRLRIDQSHEQTSARFAIDAGCLEEVQVAWPGIAVSTINRYPISLLAILKDDRSQSSDSKIPSIDRDQFVAEAKFAKQTINLTGSPDDWAGITPVIMDSQQFENGRDPTYLLNPNLEPSGVAAGHPDRRPGIQRIRRYQRVSMGGRA
jgi:hypothetical protein